MKRPLKRQQKEVDLMVTEVQMRQLQTSIRLLNGQMKELVKVMERLPKVSESVSDSVSDVGDNIDKAEKQLTSFGKVAETLTNPNGGFAKFRRIMYGFGFQGFFRGFNKVISVLEQTDFALRKIPKTGDKVKKIFKALGPDFSKFDETSDSLRDLRGMRRNLIKRSGGNLNRFSNPKGAAELRRLDARIRGVKSQRRQGIAEMFMGGSKEERAAAKDKGREARRKSIEKGLEFFTKIFKNIGRAFSKLIIGSLYYIVLISTFLILAYFIIKGLWPQIKEALIKTFEVVKKVGKIVVLGFMLAFDGLKDIFKGLFGGGDITDVVDGIFKVLGGMITVSLGVAAVLVAAAVTFVVVFIKATFMRLYDGIIDIRNTARDDILGAIKKAVKGILMIMGVVAAILALIFGFPAFVALAIVVGITYLLKKLKFFANGGVVNSPMQVVGERGPELVSLPQGSRVHSNKDSRKMMGSGGNTFNITINARDTSNAELRRIADEIGRMVNSKVNRSVSSRTLG